MTMKATLAALVIGAFALAACAPAVSDPTDAVREIPVTMTDELRFEPDTITVAAGESVRFVIHNAGASDHEFLIGDEAAQDKFAAEMADHDDAHVAEAGIALGAGETGEFTYAFGEPGELLIGCHEPGHYDGGMVARITVRP